MPGDLNEREARFWDEHEEKISLLYSRPHDWRFVPALADRIVAPRYGYLRRVLARHRREIGSLLDIGCGNGWFCHAAAAMGIRSLGVDLSPRKIDAARERAERLGLGGMCRFFAADATEFDPGERVDLLASNGSLHHLPGLEEVFPAMVERLLRPGGLMLFSEPNHEGMPPGLRRFLTRLAGNRLFGRFFDLEFYAEVTAGRAGEGGGGFDLRGESPAGLEFAGGHKTVGEVLKELGYPLVEERFFHLFAGHLANAFYVFMKPRAVKLLFRVLLPALVRLDTWMCRRPGKARYAEEGVWFFRAPGTTQGKGERGMSGLD